ncbi:methionine ABC transporter ATP-binding protein [Alsobacter sp. SYSU M60028]|uniref:Methionine ABC transporter ATP-binding protein n=1 Tax=Alsobacter ponti TaxID=2962936 RepID=A0ABT1L9B9_9HYPH|nr:methionine ABC transporter ATP-binding protein [Alsobacter ponti]MCP8937340.1 methionine ABC transporter ATP-binding protein [Alsobacter ponti]
MSALASTAPPAHLFSVTPDRAVSALSASPAPAISDRAPTRKIRTLVALEGVGKVFAGRRGQSPVAALEDIDLNVADGEILGVIGRSGAGKSTLIRLVNGLEQATSGRVLLDGVDVTAQPESAWRQARRGIGMIFQHFNLLSSRTVFDNVALPLEIAGASRGEVAPRVKELLALVDLSDKAGRYPAELSGGQKQRVGIARALATRPRLLLCDEATSALDPETTRSILALLARVNRELGVTILLITHEIPVIKEICHQVAVIEGGRIVEQGDVFEVLTRPAHPATRALVSSVVGVELPKSVADSLLPMPVPGGRTVLRISFTSENATAPVVSRISTVVGVDLNILAGRIDSIGERPFGVLVVAVPSHGPALAAVQASLRSLALETEQLGHVA